MNFTGLKFGELIDKLKRMPQDEPVKFDFVHFGPTTVESYRGYYEDAALGYATPDSGTGYNFPTVSALVAHLEATIGKVFHGWKGGNGRPITRDSSLWVANPSETGDTVVVDVQELTYVTLITRQDDERQP